MELLRSLLFSGSSNKDKLKIKRDKESSQWMVMKGHDIMYIGTKEKCMSYMSHT